MSFEVVSFKVCSVWWVVCFWKQIISVMSEDYKSDESPLCREESSCSGDMSGGSYSLSVLWWGVCTSCHIAGKRRKKGDNFLCLFLPSPSPPPPPHECVLLCYRQNILMSFIVIGLSLLIIINSKEDFQEVLSGLYFIFYWQHPKLQVCLGLWTPQKNVRVRSPP